MHESLDTQHTDLLVALRHTGRLARAAEQLTISPSAASHRLKEAERRLGVALTEADGRSLRLTAAGSHLAEVAEVTQSTLRAAEETARWMSAVTGPTVRLALDFYDTAPWFEELIAIDEPLGQVDAVRVPYDGALDAVQRRRVDVAVTVASADDPTQLAPTDPRPGHHWPDLLLADDELVGVVRTDHPASARGVLEPQDIRDSTYATAGDRPQHGFEHHEFFEPAGVRPHRLRKIESLAMVLRLITRYGGITVQPRLALRRAPLTDLAVVPLAGAAIRVRWRFLLRRDPRPVEVATCDAIRSLVATSRPDDPHAR